MTAMLTDNLPLIAAAPGGIKKLRELILELAVRGRLVPQDSSDEPAISQIRRIQEVRRSFPVVERRKAKLESTKHDDDVVPYELPPGWEWVRLADISKILNGRAYKKEELLESGTPVLRVGNLFTSDHWYYSDLALESDKYCDSGDLIFAWSASFGPFIWNGGRAIYHYHIWKLDLPAEEDLAKYYLYNFLLAKTQAIKASGHGVAMTHMTKEKMERLWVPIPPLAEQHRIVTKVDELMALCDRLESGQADSERAHQQLVTELLATLTQSATPDDFAANWQRQSQHFDTLFTTEASIDALKQTILQLAVMGKLVPQDPNDEPSCELLKRLFDRREEKISLGLLRRPQPLESIREDEKPYELPLGWEWARLGDVGDTNIGLTYKPSDVSEKGIPVLRSNNIQQGKLDLSDLKRVDVVVRDIVLANQGDILICARNGSRALVGKAALVKGIDEKMAFGAFMAIFRSELNEYLLRFINSPLFRKMIDEVNTMTINQITQENLRSTIFPLPPVSEQSRIVTKVDELISLCDALKSRLIESRAAQEKLSAVFVEQAVA